MWFNLAASRLKDDRRDAAVKARDMVTALMTAAQFNPDVLRVGAEGVEPATPTGITGRMSAPPETSSPEVCSFRLPQMCGFRLPLTLRRRMSVRVYPRVCGGVYRTRFLGHTFALRGMA